MKNINSITILIVILLLTFLESKGQNKNSESPLEIFNWEGRWEFKVTPESFCNIHIVTNFIKNLPAPTAVIEGQSGGKPFRVKCSIKEILNRNSLAFHEIIEDGGTAQYSNERPILILALKKEGARFAVNPIWGEIDITKNEVKKTFSVKKIPNPKYKGTYTLVHEDVKTSLIISKALPSIRIPSDPLYNKVSFQSKLVNKTTSLNCPCTLQTTHLALCYHNEEKSTFYLEFNEDGAKLIQNYDDDVYNTKIINFEEGGDIVLHSTFTK